jgi:hypothetical protein
MWILDGNPEHFSDGHGTAGYDGDWWKWCLRRGEDRTFTVVKAPTHVLARAGSLTERTRIAAQTLGRSEVERHLADGIPPRVVELRADGREPEVSHREPVGGLVS